MPAKNSTKTQKKSVYFSRNGKSIARKGALEQEFISSLAEIDILAPTSNPVSVQTYANQLTRQTNAAQAHFAKLQVYLANTLEPLKTKAITFINENPKMVFSPKAVMPAIAFIVILSTFAFVSTFASSGTTITPKYSIFASKPLTLGEVSGKIYGEDSRAETLNKVFEKYKCPFVGMGSKFVEEADRNNIPFWIVPAISFQESNCGRKTPKADDKQETYNAWGWAVWGNNVHGFDSWEHGIKVLSKYINTKFYSKGTTELCEIMKVYTPPSDGSWCNGVTYFKDVIENYTTPIK